MHSKYQCMRNVVNKEDYQCDELIDVYINGILYYELIFTGGYFITILYNVFTNILDIKVKSKIDTLEQTFKKTPLMKNLRRNRTNNHEELKLE